MYKVKTPQKVARVEYVGKSGYARYPAQKMVEAVSQEKLHREFWEAVKTLEGKK